MIDSIKLNESASFDLGLEISGDASGKPSVRFNIIRQDGMRLVFEANRVDNGVYKVELPALENMISEGTYACEIDVIIGNKFFTPVSDTIKIEKDVIPTVVVKKTQTVSENLLDAKVVVKKTDESVEVKHRYKGYVKVI